MYMQLRDARSDGDKARVLTICKDAVELLNHAIKGGTVNDIVPATVTEEESTQDF